MVALLGIVGMVWGIYFMFLELGRLGFVLGLARLRSYGMEV